MSRAWLRLVLLGVIGNAGVAARGLAQPAPAPSAADTQKARQYTNDGLDAARRGDYDVAIGFYQQAYDLVPHPTLLFDMAEAHRLAGQIDEALALYRRYLVAAPNGPLAADAHDRIAELEKGRKPVAPSPESSPSPPNPTSPPSPPPPASPVNPASPPSSPPAATPPSDVSAAEAAAPGRTLRIAGIVIGVGGVVALGDSIRWAIRSKTLNDDVEQQFSPSKNAAGPHANTVAYEALAIGSALVVAGAGVYWWGYTQGRSAERVSLAPVVSDQSVGLVVAGTWR